MPANKDDPHAASVAFGRRIRELRDEHDLSQDALADKTDIHPTAIGRMERGAREPRLTTIIRLADGLGVTPGDLLNPIAADILKSSKSTDASP
jgi:transcriptional regulator with XRE-family HTH domain